MKNINKQELHSIFQEIKQGNNKIDELYEKYYKLVYNIAFSILKNRENSEDVAQLVFEKIIQVDKSKLPTDSEATWLYSLTKNETLNYLRKQKENVSIDEIYYLSKEDKDVENVLDRDNYNRIISKLNDTEREIVSLKLLADLSFKEISQILNMPIGTVQWKYYTSLHTLKLILGNLSMFILGILIFMSGNMSERKIDELNIMQNIQNETEKENFNEENSDAGCSIDESNSTDSIIQNEIIEIPDTPNIDNSNFNIGILSITGIFLLFSIIFTVIFIKHQQKRKQNVSK